MLQVSLSLGLKMLSREVLLSVISPESKAIDHRKMLLEICNLLEIDASIKIDDLGSANGAQRWDRPPTQGFQSFALPTELSGQIRSKIICRMKIMSLISLMT